MARNRQRAKQRKEKLPDDGGMLSHVSGEVDEAQAAIVAGAAGLGDELDPNALAGLDEEQLGSGAGDVAAPPSKPSGFRIVNFARASWAELQRVQWPDRRQVGQATAVVMGFVLVAGAFLGLADLVAQKLVDLIL